MSAIEQVERMTLDDFIRRYQERPFEIIEGEIYYLMPPVAMHGLMVRALFLLLYQHCLKHQLGEVITEMPFVLTYDSNWVRGARVPDVMFFTAARWGQYIQTTQDWQGKPFVLVPDLAVEVVSPNDLYTQIQAKVETYQKDGVRLIWVVDAGRKRVTVYHGSQFKTLDENGTLSGEDVLPGLEISLAELFGQLS